MGTAFGRDKEPHAPGKPGLPEEEARSTFMCHCPCCTSCQRHML